MATEITDFQSLLKAAREESQPQRLLFVFLQPVLPADHTAEEARRFHAGQGGALDPIVCVDKGLDELTTFEDLVVESEAMGAAWRIVVIAAMSGANGVEPTTEDAEEPLQMMLQTIKDGRSLAQFIAFDRNGESVHFG
jgi:hypothetical protein